MKIKSIAQPKSKCQVPLMDVDLFPALVSSSVDHTQSARPIAIATTNCGKFVKDIVSDSEHGGIIIAARLAESRPWRQYA